MEISPSTESFVHIIALDQIINNKSNNLKYFFQLSLG